MANRSKGLQLIISGAPACGKGTQCEMIRDAYGLVHLSTGDMLREAVQDPESDIGRTAKEFMEAGKLVPDEVIIKVVVDRLGKDDCKERGWLLDGFPRTPYQATALSKAGYIPDQFIFIDVPDSILVARVVGRRTDPETGKIYHLTFSPPETDEIASRLKQRADDTEEKVKVRLQAFHENLGPILKIYKQYTLRVNGDAGKKDIFKRIKGRVDRIRRFTVVFVLGGPGSGKGTQCANIVREFGFTHLSAGDLLRAEQENSESEVGELIKSYIKEGTIVPVKVTIQLIKNAMELSGARNFLIDGFPRSYENMEGWFEVIGDEAEVAFVLFFGCTEETMTERLLTRGATSGRADDNMDTIKKRFSTFQNSSLPVVEAFGRLGKVRVVNSAPAPDVVFSRVSKLFHGLALIPPIERTFALIKPDAVHSADAIIEAAKKNGFVVIEKKYVNVTNEQADTFFAELKDTPSFGELKEFIMSGQSLALSLERVDAIRVWNDLIGPSEIEIAKNSNPESIRAQFGTDDIRNAVHGSKSTLNALHELTFWFPTASGPTRTLAMIKPGAAVTAKHDIMCCLASRGFEILKEMRQVIPRTMAAEFYAEHTGKSFFDPLLSYMTSDEVVALMLQREGAVLAWRALMGPTDSAAARLSAPDSIRALFGIDGRRNATHGSDSAESSARECMFWFPDRWTGEGAKGASPSEKAIAQYMTQYVDPVLAPLVQKLVISRPDNVVEFVVEELRSLQN